MNRIIVLALIILGFHTCNGQDSRIDSVLRMVKKHPRDTTGVKALLWLGIQAPVDNSEPALKYFKNALRVSESISSREYLAESSIELGNLYHVDGDSDSSLYFHRKALAVAPPRSEYSVSALVES